MNAVAFIISCALLLFCLDRVRQINWKTTLWPYVAMYACYALFLLGTIYQALTEGIDWFVLFGLGGMACWLGITRPNWRQGVPQEARTAPAPLGPAEVETLP
jgi:hypothetical protein